MNDTNLHIDGRRETGLDVRTENVTAALSIANIIKSSFGPVGLDKMLVDEVGDVTVTNDGATILKLLEVEHPAAKILVELAQLQDQEVGDGTTSVVLIAAELLRRANDLVRTKIHPTVVITGFRQASKEAIRFINESLAYDVNKLGEATMINAAKTSISSKILGGEEADFFARLAYDSLRRVKTSKGKYPVKAVNVLKAPGKGAKDSVLIDGYALNCTVASEQMPRVVKNARIAFVDFNLSKAKMQFGVKIIAKDARKLEEIKERENTMARDSVQLIIKSGANVVLCTKGIDDLVLKYFVEAGVMAVRRCKKEDLRRIAKASGGTIVTTLANLDGGESFDVENLGVAEEVAQHRVADEQLILLKGLKNGNSSSVILRGPNSMMLDEMERSFHDAICVVKRVLESERVVPGGGAVEAALSVHLERWGHRSGGIEQSAVHAFAQALLVIPKTLSINAAQDATELVAQLVAHHNSAQIDTEKSEARAMGLDLINGKVIDNIVAGVVEPAMSKVRSIQSATEASISILRIDDVIRLNPKQDPRAPQEE